MNGCIQQLKHRIEYLIQNQCISIKFRILMGHYDNCCNHSIEGSTYQSKYVFLQDYVWLQVSVLGILCQELNSKQIHKPIIMGIFFIKLCMIRIGFLYNLKAKINISHHTAAKYLPGYKIYLSIQNSTSTTHK